MATVTTSTQPRQRFQFSLKLILLIMAIVACVFGVSTYFYDPPARPIIAAQANQIKKGMTERQVARILGSPHRTEIHGSTIQWAFDFIVTTELPDAHLEIVFDSDGRAMEINCSGYELYSDASGRIVVPVSEDTSER